MLLEYELENFKGFTQPGLIPIRPITLIYGPNSSGKSSILQSLLLLKQTLEESENAETLLLPKGSLCDLGGTRELISHHDTSKTLAFRFTLDLRRSERFMLPSVHRALRVLDTPTAGIRVAFHFGQQTGAAELGSIQLFLGSHPQPAITYRAATEEEQRRYRRGSPSAIQVPASESLLVPAHIDKSHPFWKALWDKYGPQFVSEVMEYVTRRIPETEAKLQRYIDEGASRRTSSLEAPKRRAKKRLENSLRDLRRTQQHFGSANFDLVMEGLATSLAGLMLSCRNFLPSYVRPTSPDSEETLDPMWSGMFDGDDTARVVIYASNLLRRFLGNLQYIGPLREFPERHYIFSGNPSDHVGKSGKMVADVLYKNRHLLDQVNRALEQFKFGYQLQLAEAAPHDEGLQGVFALRLKDKHSGVNASIADVGFGLSQVLPLIVQAVLSRNKTLCIEQPEIHLHPRLQAELGSLLAEAVANDRGNRFLVETHSEHLMLRLQRLIRTRALDADKVAVIYVDRRDSGSQWLHLRLDRRGRFIDHWPDGFFDDDYKEIFG